VKARLLAACFLALAALSALGQATDPGLPSSGPEREAATRARESLRGAPAVQPAPGLAGEVLANRKFHDPGAARARPMLKETSKQAGDFFKQVAEAVARMLGRAAASGPGGTVPVPAWVWVAVASAIVAGLLFAYVWSYRARTLVADDLLDGESGLSADEWLVRADNLAAQGHHREAFRCIYVALLVRLAEHGVADFRRHETNWEHVRRAERSPSKPRGLDLRGPTRMFDEGWYGRRPVDSGQVATLRELYQRTVRTLEGRLA
jgi:hypothetical protein